MDFIEVTKPSRWNMHKLGVLGRNPALIVSLTDMACTAGEIYC